MNVKSTFTDKKYIADLIEHLRKTTSQTPLEELVTLSGVRMNWISDYITDPSTKWKKQSISIDSLTLTGTNPKWNKIVIEKCGRSLIKLRQIFNSAPNTKKIFNRVHYSNIPILVRREGNQLKVLDGMKRVIAAILAGDKNINAFIAKPSLKRAMPKCEPHVVYDLLKAYQRGLNKDKKGLIMALRFLRKSYGNVPNLLKERFCFAWIPDKEMQAIIKKALENK